MLVFNKAETRNRDTCGQRDRAVIDAVLKKTKPGIIKQLFTRNTSSPIDFRKQKVSAIRRQIVKGTYDIEGRFSVAVDRLLEDLISSG